AWDEPDLPVRRSARLSLPVAVHEPGVFLTDLLETLAAEHRRHPGDRVPLHQALDRLAAGGEVPADQARLGSPRASYLDQAAFGVYQTGMAVDEAHRGVGFQEGNTAFERVGVEHVVGGHPEHIAPVNVGPREIRG